MYTLAVIPLINKLQELHGNTNQVWFADDVTAASTCQPLRAWWDDLTACGPSFGYYPKASKTFLVVKEEYADAEAEAIFNELPLTKQRLLACTRERSAFSWVFALPIDEHGFFLHKGDFRDALCLRYGWQISNLPLHCACGDPLSIDHALCCHKGGFPTLHHNEIRDMSANLLREVYPNMCTEPSLQPLNSETSHFQLRTARPSTLKWFIFVLRLQLVWMSAEGRAFWRSRDQEYIAVIQKLHGTRRGLVRCIVLLKFAI